MNGKRSDRNLAVFSLLKAAAKSGGAFPTPRELEASERLVTRPRGGGLRSVSPRRMGSRRAMSFQLIPVAGFVSAGFGDPVEPTDLGSIPVDLAALNIPATTRTFALRVRGDSMTGAQIADGDLVVIEAREPKIGDIVAALIDGETTLKRFVAEDGQMFLRAENAKYPDRIPLRELTIQGVMRAVVRVCGGNPPVL
jgi:repressor LexA